MLNSSYQLIARLIFSVFVLVNMVICVFPVFFSQSREFAASFLALMSLILCASYLCVLCQPVCLPPIFFVPMRSCQACPISRWDIKGVWGASKSAGLRDKLHSPCPQLLSLIKPPGWHRERRKRAARGAGRLFKWKKGKKMQIIESSTYCPSLGSDSPFSQVWNSTGANSWSSQIYFFFSSNMLIQRVWVTLAHCATWSPPSSEPRRKSLRPALSVSGRRQGNKGNGSAEGGI